MRSQKNEQNETGIILSPSCRPIPYSRTESVNLHISKHQTKCPKICYTTCMKVVSGIVLTFLLGAIFVSLFNMSMGMDMSGRMSGCPSMTLEKVLCPINLASHIDEWKAAFLAITPSITLLLAVLGVVSVPLAFFLFTPKIKDVTFLFRQLLRKSYSYFYRPMQELFSSGILNPKLF